MPVSNLARVFGPTIVGYSTADPEPLAMLNETKQQARVRTKSNIDSTALTYCSEVQYNCLLLESSFLKHSV
jgi:hypothetical protein